MLVQIDLTQEEIEAIKEMAEKLDLEPFRVIKLALRHYQSSFNIVEPLPKLEDKNAN